MRLGTLPTAPPLSGIVRGTSVSSISSEDAVIPASAPSSSVDAYKPHTSSGGGRKRKDAPSSKSSSGRTSNNSNEKESVPIFLKKTYHMIEQCESDIAEW